LKVRADAKQRLAESFETALRHADGRALAVEMDSEKEHLFSAKFAWPGVQLRAARAGAAPVLDSTTRWARAAPATASARSPSSTGRAWSPFPHLSLASGAIKAGTSGNQFFFMMLQSLAMHYGFDLDTPFEDLPARIVTSSSNGSGKEPVGFQYLAPRGGFTTRQHPFEGCSPTWSDATTSPTRWRCARNSPIPEQQALPGLPRHAPARGRRAM